MLRFNTSWFIESFKKIDAIDAYISRPLASTYQIARDTLHVLFTETILSSSFKASVSSGSDFIDVLNFAISRAETESETASIFGPIILEKDSSATKAKWAILRSIILAELSVSPTYYVAQKGPYDTEVLIENGQRLFPEELLKQFPNTLDDAQMAGKALAFEMPAACAFHVFRLLEIVVDGYMSSFGSQTQNSSGKTLGQKAHFLENNRIGDEAIYVALRDITKIHRNSIIHADKDVTLSDAVSLVGMTHGIIAPMISHIVSQSRK